ncbi:MAG: hypothetical protein ABIR47_11935 [Candidatus Kapaibacterium sp.]
MILYYAIGGGLGHLTRARALLHTLRRGERATIVTASRFAKIPDVAGDAEIIMAPPELGEDREGAGIWLNDIITGIGPEEIFIDTFPAGILGELRGMKFPSATRLHHVARLLRWDRYLPIISGDAPHYSTTFRAEPLTEPHAAWLAGHSEEMVDLTLNDPPTPHDPEQILRTALPAWNGERPLWLVIHSEPIAELLELIGYARELAAMEDIDPLLAIVTPLPVEGLPPEIPLLHMVPSSILFPLAARIITGCGFNAMRQTEPHRERHHCIPFPRRYDDQFLRGARRRATSRPSPP